MNHKKPGADNGEIEIPMVAAFPAPLSGGEEENTVHVYSCCHVDDDENDNDDNNRIQIESTTDTTPSRVSASVASATLDIASPSRPISSVHFDSSATTAVSTLDNCTETTRGELESNPAYLTPQQQYDPATPSSPSISAIATPEPMRHYTHSLCEESATATATGTPVVEPLEIEVMEQLSSPTPSMVVTDEQTMRAEQDTMPHSFGKWRTTLCSFWCDSQIICSSFPWMSCCCSSIVLGQLMTRLRLDWCARENHEASVRTFGIIATITFGYIITLAFGVGVFVMPFFTIWLWILATKLRYLIRQHYGIPPQQNCFASEVSDGILEDCCYSVWCLCCSTIQMARQTHDEKRFPYESFSPNGLPTFAPSIPIACSIQRQ